MASVAGAPTIQVSFPYVPLNLNSLVDGFHLTLMSLVRYSISYRTLDVMSESKASVNSSAVNFFCFQSTLSRFSREAKLSGSQGVRISWEKMKRLTLTRVRRNTVV